MQFLSASQTTWLSTKVFSPTFFRQIKDYLLLNLRSFLQFMTCKWRSYKVEWNKVFVQNTYSCTESYEGKQPFVVPRRFSYYASLFDGTNHIKYSLGWPVVHRVMGCRKKKKIFKLVWQYYKLLSGLLANGHLSRVSRQSHLLTNGKSDDGWNRNLCTDIMEFTLRLRKISAWGPSDEGCTTSHCLKRAP